MLSASELVIFEFSLGKLFTAIEQDSGAVKRSLYSLFQILMSFFFLSPRGNFWLCSISTTVIIAMAKNQRKPYLSF